MNGGTTFFNVNVALVADSTTQEISCDLVLSSTNTTSGSDYWLANSNSRCPFDDCPLSYVFVASQNQGLTRTGTLQCSFLFIPLLLFFFFFFFFIFIFLLFIFLFSFFLFSFPFFFFLFFFSFSSFSLCSTKNYR